MTTDSTRGTARGARRFRAALAATVVILALLATTLALVNAHVGPRVSGVQANPAVLVTRAGQKVVIQSDQVLAQRSADGITIEPQIDFDASVVGDTIEVRFASMLHYGTDYTIRVPEAVSAYTGTTAVLETTVSTSDPYVYTLLRETRTGDDGAKLPDTVRRQPLSSPAESEAVLSAPFIQEYAVTTSLLAAVLLEETTAAVQIANSDGGETYTLPLPSAGSVRQLRGSGVSDLLGFSFSGEIAGEAVENILFLYDNSDGSGVPEPLVGLDGEPLTVSDWTFVPGTTSLVAQTYDQSLYLIDALSDGAPVPLGQHGEMRGFLPGGDTLIVNDPDGEVALDLASGESEALALPEAAADIGGYPGEIVLLDESLDYLQMFTTPLDEASSTYESSIALVTAEGTRVVHSPAAEGTRIRDFCVSPNGQYLAVETAPADSTLDNYPVVGGYSQMSTFFVDIATGEASRGAYGFLPDWCR